MRRNSTLILLALGAVLFVGGCSGSSDAEKDTAAVTKTMPKRKPGERLPGLAAPATGGAPAGGGAAGAPATQQGTAAAATD